MNEFELIRRHFHRLGHGAVRPVVPNGDDAAVFQPAPGCQVVVCCDTLIEGVHFSRDTAPGDIGWKSLAVNLSDLAAMGADPVGFLLALSLPSVDAQWVEALAAGLRQLADESRCPLLGGDTTRGPLSLTVTAIGSVPEGQAITRDGAQPGDRILLSGPIGDAAAALAMPDGPADLHRRLLRPQPRLSLGSRLRGVATAAIDLSDGLAADLGHVLDASGCGARIEAVRLPMSAALNGCATAEQRLRWQLHGGDDYELCVTIPPDRVPPDAGLIDIGECVAGSRRSLKLADGDTIALTAEGFRHF